MPIKPEATNSPIPTTGPKITLETGESIELSWQERALCAQTDPEAFFPEKGGRRYPERGVRDRSHDAHESGV